MEDSSLDSPTRFLASTLHEIRTPIQTIISTIELLQDTPLNKEQTEYVHQIEFSANVLLQLANDVLDFTKIRSKEFKLENIPFDVADLTEKVVDLISIEAFDRHLEIITDIDDSVPVLIMGDPTRLQQIILNLIKNAVKFTSSGYVMVKVRKDGDKLLFQVIDSGIGVPEEKQALIFKNFYQVDASTTRKYGGTGLGLSICKNLVEVMKGEIGVKSNPNPEGGSIFWFTIPLETPATDILGTENSLKIPESTKVLVVDDNSYAAESFLHKLQETGIKNITIASSGEEALRLCKEQSLKKTPFTIAFIDMIMPEMDGWRLASQLNNNAEVQKLSLYLMIPEGQMGKDAKMKQLNWYKGYLYKPVKRQHLKDLLTEELMPAYELLDMEKEAESKPVIPVADESQLASKLKILVAEDHPVNRKLINTFLERFGATVFLAENGEEAVQQVAAHPDIDLIFMDIQMPVKNGTDATIELRSNNFNGVIVACTANNNPADFEEYTKMGINDILVKPFKKDAIKQILEKWTAVLSVPDAREILSLTDINNTASDLWDVNDFIDTVGGDKKLAAQIMDDYLEQTTNLLKQIKEELQKPEKQMKTLQIASHTLKGSSGAISAHKLSEYGKKMNDAAKNKNLIALEAARTDFAIDFLELKKIVKKWKSTLS